MPEKDSQRTFRWSFIHSFLEQRIEKKSKWEGRERSQCKVRNEEQSRLRSKYRLPSVVLTLIWGKKKLAKAGPVTGKQVCQNHSLASVKEKIGEGEYLLHLQLHFM